MINGKSVLAIIPARGGSKGVPRKNIKNLAGKPLIAWTIEEAKKSKYIDRLILSSDDAEIISTAQQWGCEAPFVRPKELAEDDTPGIAPVLHALRMLPGYDYVVLLQPTSPLRTCDDIDGALETCINNQADTCASVSETKKSPYWMYTLTDDNRLKPVLETVIKHASRQELPATYELNGALYIAKADHLIMIKSFVDSHTIAFLMPKERSVDIDSEIDFDFLDHQIRHKL